MTIATFFERELKGMEESRLIIYNRNDYGHGHTIIYSIHCKHNNLKWRNLVVNSGGIALSNAFFDYSDPDLFSKVIQAIKNWLMEDPNTLDYTIQYE
jgi:hypothetical protein